MGLFWAYYMLFFYLITVTQHCHWVCIHATWVSLTHSITYGLPWPISSSLGILGPLSFLGHPWSIPTLHSHRLLLILLGFPGLITISFTFGVHALSINPLLTYFITLGLPWSILTVILPMSLLLLSLLFLLCYSCYATLLFLLWCYLTCACWASFEPATCFSFTWLQWPNIVIRSAFMLLGFHWPIPLLTGFLGPFLPPWASSAHFLSLGILGPFQLCIPMGFC